MKKLVVVTTAFYKSRELLRFRLACETVRLLTAGGYTTAIVDDSPDSSIAETLRELGANVYRQEERGMGPSRRQVFGLARQKHDAEIVQWMEPEKTDFVRLIPQVIKPIEDDVYDIVHAERTDKSWETFPVFQATLEKKSNAEYADLVGIPGFGCYLGPVAYSAEMADELLAFDPKAFGLEDTYVQIFSAARSWRTGARLGCVKLDFVYPSEQKLEEETTLSKEIEDKRIWQAESVMKGVRVLVAS